MNVPRQETIVITVEQIEKNIIERARPRLTDLERMIDARLEEEWEKGNRKIPVNLPAMTPRIIVDELARMYRAGKHWDVELGCQSDEDRTAGRYNVLKFEKHVEQRYYDGR